MRRRRGRGAGRCVVRTRAWWGLREGIEPLGLVGDLVGRFVLMRNDWLGLGVGVLVLGLAGCGADFQFSDSVDLNLDFRLLARDNDRLNTPYVAGAKMDLYADDVRPRHETDFGDWSLASSDPDVLRIDLVEVDSDDPDHVRAEAVAVGQGVADLLLLDASGDVVSSTEVPVRFPDRVELLAAAPVFLGREDIPADISSPRVLVDGEATFLVRYYEGEQRLYGNGTLEVEPGEGVDAWTDRSYMFEDRDWLGVVPEEVGSHTVDLLAAGRRFTDVEVDGVGPEAVAYVGLHGQDESKAESGDTLLVIAQAYDEASERIFGVEYSWDLAGRDEPGLGDMFRYEYDPEALSTLGANFEDARAEAEIRGVEGYVDSSNDVGCSVAKRGRTPLGGLGLLALVGFVRRRAA